MLVQIIRGRTSEADALRQLIQTWEAELGPGASGWLGATSGVTADGEYFVAARFESEEAARRNSERPEQGEWFEKVREKLEGEPTFVDSTDVELMLGGGSDDAGFVQVMEVTTDDAARYREVSKKSEEILPRVRPDVIGGLRVWHPGGNRCTEIVYFTSEEEARERESEQRPAEAEELLNEWQALQTNVDYLDLTDPVLSSP